MIEVDIPDEHKLDRIVSLKVASKVSGLSSISWRRNHPSKLIRLGPRRVGIRLRDALMLEPAR
jgi:hypothetical protein